jgi:hypothetical protein
MIIFMLEHLASYWSYFPFHEVTPMCTVICAFASKKFWVDGTANYIKYFIFGRRFIWSTSMWHASFIVWMLNGVRRKNRATYGMQFVNITFTKLWCIQALSGYGIYLRLITIHSAPSSNTAVVLYAFYLLNPLWYGNIDRVPVLLICCCWHLFV